MSIHIGTQEQAGTNNSIPGFLFIHLGTKSFVPPVKVTNVRTIADVLNANPSYYLEAC